MKIYTTSLSIYLPVEKVFSFYNYIGKLSQNGKNMYRVLAELLATWAYDAALYKQFI